MKILSGSEYTEWMRIMYQGLEELRSNFFMEIGICNLIRVKVKSPTGHIYKEISYKGTQSLK